MKKLTIPTLFMKNIYLTLLSFTLYITPALTSESPKDAFQSALEEEHAARIQKLLESHDLDVNLQNKDGHTALMAAIAQNHMPLAKQLLKRDDMDVNLQDKHGYTALVFVIAQNHMPMAQLLLQREDLDVNLQDKNGNTALVFVIAQNHLPMAKLLLQRGDLHVNLKYKDGYTALMLATDQNHIPLAQLLLKRDDIDVNVQNENGSTALMFAIYKNRILLAELLLQRDDINVNVQNKCGKYTALMLAIDQNHVRLIELLLERDSMDINLQNEFGTTALMFAICRNRIPLAELLLQRRNDIDVNLQNKEGHTPLVFAICRNDTKLLELLLQRNDIDINLQDKNGTIALSYVQPDHIDLNKPQNDNLYYVNLVKRTHLPSLGKDHALLQPSYLHTLYMQESCNQTMQPYRDILLINKIANELTEEQKTIFYQTCLIAYEAKNSQYSIQAKGIKRPKKPSHYQPVLDQDLIHLLAGYLRGVKMKRVSDRSDWVHYITCYLWTNNQFALQHNPANMSLKAIHFWSNHNSTYAELLNTANRTQNRTLFKVIDQQGQYVAAATKHLARGLKQKNIIQSEEQVLEKSLTQLMPIIVAGLKALAC